MPKSSKFLNLILLLVLIYFSNAQQKGKTFLKQTDNSNAYTAIVMGDIGQFDQYEPYEVKKAAQVVPKNFLYKTDKCEEIKLTMSNFEKGVLSYIEKLSADEAIILGDAVYTEAKGLALTLNDLKSDADKLAVKTEFLRRLNCAWTYIENLFATSKKDFLKNITIIFGNHSMDVDYFAELKHMVRFLPWRTNLKALPNVQGDFETSVLKPKISYGNGKNGKNVLYLDIDMSKLVCSEKLNDFKEFRACIKATFTHAYPSHNTDDEQIKLWEIHSYYLDELKIALNKVEHDGARWKVVRLHQPIFNIERDYYGVKNNSQLMQRFRRAGIHLWFVSHHHSGQVNIAKYETADYKYKVQADGSTRRKEYNEAVKTTNDPQVDMTLKYTGLEDYFYKQDGDKLTFIPNKKNPITINRCYELMKKCKSNVATIYIEKHNPDYIIQALAGNGGRKLDTLISDYFSDSTLLYARAMPQEFGYFTATFSGNKATLVFKNGDTTNFTLIVKQNNKKASDDNNFKADIDEILKNKFTSDAIAQ
jgi:hypothetical protein